MAGPSIQGSIVIRTDSVSQAIKHVQTLRTRMETFSQSATGGSQKVSQAIDRQAKSFASLAAQTGKMTTAQARNEALLAKAANKYAQFEAAVKKSGASQQAQVSLLQRAAGQLKGYEASLHQVAAGTAKLTNVNTQLNVGFGQLQRDLTATTAATRQEAKAQADAQKMREANLGSLSRANIQYDKVVASVRRSSLGTQEETRVLAEVQAAHQRLQKTLQSGTATRQQVSQAQRQFNETMNRTKITAQTGQMNNAAESTKHFRDEMRNLSTSVVVALGPLSGVASRLTAMTALFNRNAAAVAGLLVTMTGYSVLLSRSVTVGTEAEKQMARLASQLEVTGERAQVTGAELEYMAHSVAAATLTSAKEARDASSTLLGFGGIARNQFQDVLLAAQGMSAVFGGGLQQNARRLGRAIEDPIDGLTRLERQGVILEQSVKDQIATLVNQGRQYEATNVLISEMTDLQEAAKGEADSLAGAYDTLQGNLDKLYQSLFSTSGAGEAAKDSVSDLAAAVENFTGSDFAKVLGESFKWVAQFAGGTMNMFINNIEAVGAIIAIMAGSTIPRMILRLTQLAAGMVKAKTSTDSATRSMVTYDGVVKSTTRSSRAFAAVSGFMAGPIAGVATALITTIATIVAYNKAKNSLTEGTTLAAHFEEQAEKILASNQKISKAARESLEAEVATLAEKTREQEKHVDLVTDRQQDLRDEFISTTRSMSNFYMGMNPTAVDEMAKAIGRSGQVTGHLSSTYNDLSDEQKGMIDQLAEQYKAVKASTAAMEELGDKQEELVDRLKSGDFELPRDYEKELKSMISSLKEMEGELYPDTKRLRALEEQERKLQDQIKAMEELANEGQDVNEAYNLATKLLAKIRQEKQAVNAVEISNDAKRFAENAREAAIELQKMQDIYAAGGDENGIIAMRYEVDAMAESLKQMSGADLQHIRDSLPNVDDAAGPREIAKAFLEMENQSESLKSALDSQQEAREQLQTDFEAIRNELNPLGAAMEDHGHKMRVLQQMYAAVDTESAREEIRKLIIQLNEAFSGQNDDDDDDGVFDLQGYATQVDAIANYTTDSFTAMSAQVATIFDDMGKGISESMQQSLVSAGGVMDGMMNLMEATNREQSKEYKAFAMAQALMAGGVAVSKALAEGGPYAGPVLAAIAAANTGAQIARIQSAEYATGGYVAGPGSSMSDSIPARLSNGEYVMRASAVQALGVDTLDALNEGRAAPFAVGGVVGVPTGGGGGNTSPVNLTIVDNSQGQKSYSSTEETDENGVRQLRVQIDSIVKDSISRGKYDREMASSYGTKRQGRRV